MTLVYLVAGEASGDILGARLIAALRARRPDLRVAGIGGARMQAEGLVSLFPMEELSLMGLAEVLPSLARLIRRMGEAEADILTQRPAALVTIDAPSFTLRLAARVRPKGVRVVHYVAPQVWAWRPWRVKRIAASVDRLLCLLPFEPSFFAKAGIDARFVGHPILEGAVAGDANAFRQRNGIAADAKVLVVMPGSRGGELNRHLPVFGAAIDRLREAVPGFAPVALALPRHVARIEAAWPRIPVLSADGEKRDALAAATAALVKSGTSSLEVALAGVPQVVAYKVNPITAAIVRRLVKVRHASLVNILATTPAIPELIQEACTGETLAATLAPLLADPAAAAAQHAAYAEARAALSPPGGQQPSEAAADAVLAAIDEKTGFTGGLDGRA
ncbi:lipid-A-disaccharide synthase [Elioraea sp.]|uniref:lipid-A-disaccharide synthase n=1 Tax=Elioraea sp. TaxID=2185103 RepID=UPI0025C58549|nr:lipid-A-disaccharide synthase [Elioraea sp.]